MNNSRTQSKFKGDAHFGIVVKAFVHFDVTGEAYEQYRDYCEIIMCISGELDYLIAVDIDHGYGSSIIEFTHKNFAK